MEKILLAQKLSPTYVEEVENIFFHKSCQTVSTVVGYFVREPLVPCAALLCFLCKSGNSHDLTLQRLAQSESIIVWHFPF